MVIAGPGSGKTTVITHRTKHLIEHGVRPENILVITFSKAAALEMQHRFTTLCEKKSESVNFGTFHSVFFQILRVAYGYTGANIVRDEWKYQFAKQFLAESDMEYEEEKELIGKLFQEVGIVKNSMISLQHYYATSCSAGQFRDFYHQYEQFLRTNGFLDFDDMLIFCYDLLSKRPDIRKKWQTKFQYILVDEFQDINSIQYRTVQLLAGYQNNLFIVGDDDQSVYRFRGAKPEIMQQFLKDYPNAETITLNINYRCGSEITKISNRLIKQNRLRFQKKILSSGQSEQGLVTVKHFRTQREENLFIIKEIQKKLREGRSLKEIALLYRTNSGPRFIMEQLSGFNISYVSKDQIPSLYNHWIVRDLFTYIKIAKGERTRRNFLRIMNRPNRYLSREGLPGDSIDIDKWKLFYLKQNWMVRRLEKLRIDLEVLSSMRPYTALLYIRKGIDYQEYIFSYAKERGVEEEELFEILEEITEYAKEYSSFEEWFQVIEKTETERIGQNRKGRAEIEADAVVISTYHSAKGLEYDTVFLPDLNENVIPYKKATLVEEIEEERRMLYVAMTRAKKELYLTYSDKIHNKDMDPSRFLGEIT